MERYITDAIYNNIPQRKSVEMELAQKRLYTKLSSVISGSEYLPIEEELNRIYSEVEKELFCCGFVEGIRFLISCMK